MASLDYEVEFKFPSLALSTNYLSSYTKNLKFVQLYFEMKLT